LSESCDELGVGLCKLLAEESIGSGQVSYSCSIGSGGGSEIGHGVDCVLMVSWDVMGAESGRAWFGFECFAVLLIGYREVKFELWPSFVRSSLPFPDFAVIRKYSRAEHQLKCNARTCWVE
jgi:hypothetical protein